jgi:hypothetical protein
MDSLTRHVVNAGKNGYVLKVSCRGGGKRGCPNTGQYTARVLKNGRTVGIGHSTRMTESVKIAWDAVQGDRMRQE